MDLFSNVQKKGMSQGRPRSQVWLTELSKDLFKVGHEFPPRNIEVEFQIGKDGKLVVVDFFRVDIQFIINGLNNTSISKNK